jgi:hypothetical protein
MTSTAERICDRLGQMKSERLPHENVWRACFDVTYPERGNGLNGDQMTAETIQARKAEILDSTATDGTRMLASQVQGGMTPANSNWIALDVGEESDDERRWLDHAAEVMWEAIHASNYDAAKFEALIDSLNAGWFVMYIDEDRKTGQLVFDEWPIAQCFIASSRPGGPVDTVYRCFQLTAEQAVAEYGDKVSQKVRDDAAKKPSNKHEFVHAIYPRTEYSPGSKLPKNLPFASCHIEVSTKKEVRESGYHERPVVVARWMQLPGSPYAIGPVSNALATIRELNALLSLEKVALARAAAGVYVAQDDGVLNPRTVRVRGGSVIVANSVDSIKELPTGADFNVTFSKADQMRAEIRRLLMSDQLAPQDGPAMTATEVHVRVALIRQLLGPLYGRFQAEDLAPTIDRVFGLLYRRGRPEIGGAPGPVLIDDAPESLDGEQFRYRYQSPLARAQKLEEVTAIDRIVMMAGTMAQIGKPEALDLIDSEEAIRIAGDALGVPSKAIRDEKSLKAYRAAQNEAQQAEQQQAQQQQMMTMAADAAFKQSSAA